MKISKKFWLIALILTAYQIIRLIVFINTNGGLEEDSGWFSSIARSLAEQGIYTTMTSTIVNPAARGDINLFECFEIQNEAGRIWFWTVNGVGPGSIVPNAIILKLLGINFWTLRVGPLLFTAVFFLLASWLLYRVNGLAPLLLFHLFFVFYPHMLVYVGYEAYGEMPTMVYILLAFLAFIKAAKTQTHQTLWFFTCGLLAGLALVTKVIALFSLSSIFIGWLWLFWQRQTRLKHLVMLAIGLTLPLLLWETIILITLTHVANFELYCLHTAERLAFVFGGDAVSNFGLDNATQFNLAEFIMAKLLTITAIAHPIPLLSLLMLTIIALSGPLLIYLRPDKTEITKFILLIWIAWLINTLWYISLSKVAWVRHDWFALIYAIMLFCWLMSAWLKIAITKPSWKTAPLAVILLAVLVINFSSQWPAVNFFIPDNLVETWRRSFLANDNLINKYEQQMPWILIPRATQDEVVEYLSQLPPASQTFYAGNLTVPEVSVRVGRVFYPIQRRSFMPHSNADVVIVGARPFSPWRRPQELVEPIKADIKRQCPRILLENDYYIICSVAN